MTLFKGSFCQAGEADIQDYAPVQNIFSGSFLHITYYYYGKTNANTALVWVSLVRTVTYLPSVQAEIHCYNL